MLPLDDPRWEELEGGYRRPYDPRDAFVLLEKDGEDAEAWEELWGELHHQGDVGLASYAAVPHLVRIFQTQPRNWRLYAIVAAVELERRSKHNPQLPDWLAEGYGDGLESLIRLAAEDLTLARDDLFNEALLGAIALLRGSEIRGRLMSDFTDSELEAMHKMFMDT